MNKPKIIKDYEKLDSPTKDQIKHAFPRGFQKHLILFTDAKGRMVSALPFEGEQYDYLIRMSAKEAFDIVMNDSDYDEYGRLIIGKQDENNELDIDEIPQDKGMELEQSEFS